MYVALWIELAISHLLNQTKHGRANSQHIEKDIHIVRQNSGKVLSATSTRTNVTSRAQTKHTYQRHTEVVAHIVLNSAVLWFPFYSFLFIIFILRIKSIFYTIHCAYCRFEMNACGTYSAKLRGIWVGRKCHFQTKWIHCVQCECGMRCASYALLWWN